MPVVLRKRKAPQPPPEPPAKKTSRVAKAAPKAKGPVAAKASKPAATANGTAAKAAAAKPAVGDVIALEGFGGEVETNDGKKTTLKALVDESSAGVVLFTYPKASTPGCTTQVCLFRDSYADLTAGGLAIYGLSADSPRANTTFKDKQRLPYPLLCDPAATLIGAVGLAKSPRGTARGVFVVDAAGKVLAAETGGPARTLEVVRALVAEMAGDGDDAAAATAEEAQDQGKEEKGEEKDENEKGEEEKREEGESKEDGNGEANGGAAHGEEEAKVDGGEGKE